MGAHMIKILYFARFREKLGCGEEQVALSTESTTVADLLALLAGRGGAWQELFASPKGVMTAINQEMVSATARLHEGDEVAIFPPVTGG